MKKTSTPILARTKTQLSEKTNSVTLIHQGAEDDHIQETSLKISVFTLCCVLDQRLFIGDWFSEFCLLVAKTNKWKLLHNYCSFATWTSVPTIQVTSG